MRRLKIGLCLSPSWLRGDTWRRPDSRVEELFTADFHVDVTRLAEAAHLDFVFKPDALLLDPRALEEGPGLSSLEPLVLMGLLAAHTRHIGLIASVSAAYAQPYTVARQLQSLDLISGGRAGWNVMASLGGADNYGNVRRPQDPQANASDFIEVVESLRQSFPAEALRMDRATGQFADVRRIRRVSQIGRYASAGPLTTPARDERRLPLLHAGAAPGAEGFAARHAAAVFVMQPDAETGLAQVRGLDDAADSLGRPRRPLVLPGLSVCLADTREAAQALAGRADLVPRAGKARHWSIVGTVADAVNAIVERARSGAIDGLIALPAGSWQSLELFTTQVVPALAAVGLFREDYSGSTLAEHLAEY
ncbi:LLM class flavin-dependent oxidoreductase [Tessaracoccus palaemonis]|uniref:LLM class flavin-dependent oxidoreductase n=1 Tax=Tessaracoccus palaemonis TaxID=2829499 RepID=A0ABX8SE03_9ACTN|nr:LLM class flavin-dependent oxidoreductase [Tessaracoccus palaemonis]QXT61636.1 LLM class flavin-dependent oxidoreductase [Tessaracoccus palaemonis]